MFHSASSVILITILILLRYQTVSAFPYGVGSCAPGLNAVAGPHIFRLTTVNATFAETDIVLTFGGSIYVPGTVIPGLPGVEYSFSVDTNGEAFFRGILIRFQALDGQDLTGSLAPNENTVVTSLCNPPYVAGLSHYDSTIKGTASGKFLTNNPGRIRLDINAVIGNEPELSLWGTASFMIDVVNIGIPFTPETFAPVAPALPPAAAPVSASVPVTSPANVLQPVEAPSSSGQGRGKFSFSDF